MPDSFLPCPARIPVILDACVLFDLTAELSEGVSACGKKKVPLWRIVDLLTPYFDFIVPAMVAFEVCELASDGRSVAHLFGNPRPKLEVRLQQLLQKAIKEKHVRIVLPQDEDHTPSADFARRFDRIVRETLRPRDIPNKIIDLRSGKNIADLGDEAAVMLVKHSGGCSGKVVYVSNDKQALIDASLANPHALCVTGLNILACLHNLDILRDAGIEERDLPSLWRQVWDYRKLNHRLSVERNPHCKMQNASMRGILELSNARKAHQLAITEILRFRLNLSDRVQGPHRPGICDRAGCSLHPRQDRGAPSAALGGGRSV